MSTIIFINGTSSSGKTSLLKLLQKNLPEPYLDMGIDKFIWMLPSRYLDRPLWDDVLGKAVQAGPVGWSLFSGMHHAIAAAAAARQIGEQRAVAFQHWLDRADDEGQANEGQGDDHARRAVSDRKARGLKQPAEDAGVVDGEMS